MRTAEQTIRWLAILFLILFGSFLTYAGLSGDDQGASSFGMISVLVGVSNGIGGILERKHRD